MKIFKGEPHQSRIIPIFLIFLLILLFTPWHMTSAKTFCIDTAEELQSALTQAAGNDESDVIQLATGTYTGNFTYTSQGDKHLTINGGYTAGCASSSTDASQTVIDGNFAGSALLVDIGGAGDFECNSMTFQNGSSVQGGGVKITSINGSITFNNTKFINNHATEFGGGIYLSSDKTITLTHNIMIDNKSDYYAGAASLHGQGTLIFNANSVMRNTAEGAVGGLWTSVSSVSITNSVFTNNSGNWYHGAILIESDAASIVNNTITANIAGGVGAGLSVILTDDSDTADVLNNIIYGNSGNDEANDLHIVNDNNDNAIVSTINLLNNNFDQSAAGTYIQIPFAIDTNNLSNEIPLFMSQATGDLRLKKGSPCIDKGTSSNAPALDMAGTARPKGKDFDLGAYEYNEYPSPLITANGQDSSISTNFGDLISLAISLDPKDNYSLNADWWLVTVDPGGNVSYFDLASGTMTKGLIATYKGGLFNLGSTLLLNFSDLAVGAHTFYFGVDMNMNDTLDLSELYYDLVMVNISQ